MVLSHKSNVDNISYQHCLVFNKLLQVILKLVIEHLVIVFDVDVVIEFVCKHFFMIATISCVGLISMYVSLWSSMSSVTFEQ